MTAHDELEARLAACQRGLGDRGVMLAPDEVRALLAEWRVAERRLMVAARSAEEMRASLCAMSRGPCFCGAHNSQVQEGGA